MTYTRHMKKVATFWGKPTDDGLGNFTFPTPKLFSPSNDNGGVRWEQKSEVFRDANANEVVSSAVVYVPEELEIEGWLALGDETGESDPQSVDGAYEIRQIGFTDDLRGDKRLHKVWL